jgi:hypothetical protein
MVEIEISHFKESSCSASSSKYNFRINQLNGTISSRTKTSKDIFRNFLFPFLSDIFRSTQDIPFLKILSFILIMLQMIFGFFYDHAPNNYRPKTLTHFLLIFYVGLVNEIENQLVIFIFISIFHSLSLISLIWIIRKYSKDSFIPLSLRYCFKYFFGYFYVLFIFPTCIAFSNSLVYYLLNPSISSLAYFLIGIWSFICMLVLNYTVVTFCWQSPFLPGTKMIIYRFRPFFNSILFYSISIGFSNILFLNEIKWLIYIFYLIIILFSIWNSSKCFIWWNIFWIYHRDNHFFNMGFRNIHDK